MRRDICHYYEKDLKSVYNAYAKAATDKFGKNCEYHNEYKLSFGLNFTVRYNMNGGACTIHFMPYKSGTAVNVRYSIAQLFGARYTAYDEELTKHVVSLLGVTSTILNSDAEQFERYAAQAAANETPLIEKTPTQTKSEQSSISSPADELRKYKELLDDGIITQEEFDAKKKQLLNLL